MDIEEIAEKIAKDIFSVGNEPDSPCQRIEFKGGEWPEQETSQGGLGELALRLVIRRSLKEYLKCPTQ